MSVDERFVIVGAGLAGARTAEILRNLGFDGRIVLLGEEAARPYERPPLSKNYLQGRSEKEKLYVHPEAWYRQHDVDLRLRTRVTSVDPDAHRVGLAGGNPIGCDKLLLATGASPRVLTIPGGDPHHIFMLRRIEDCEQLKVTFETASKVVVVGAGWIGLEVAASARDAGLDVVVLERGKSPLLGVLGEEVAEVFLALHRRHGVDVRLEVQVAEVTGDQPRRATGVRLGDGAQIDADLVVAGIGAIPNSELARTAGLVVDNGIVVDEHLRSSHPDIYAAGDVARAFHPVLGKHIRIEHWANAFNQPEVVAKSMLGIDAVYDQLPYFFSDQYELGMEYSGYVERGTHDEVIFRGNKGTLEFIAFWMRNHRVMAGMNVNIWDETENIRALIRSGRQFESAQLAGSETRLADLAVSITDED